MDTSSVGYFVRAVLLPRVLAKVQETVESWSPPPRTARPPPAASGALVQLRMALSTCGWRAGAVKDVHARRRQPAPRIRSASRSSRSITRLWL